MIASCQCLCLLLALTAPLLSLSQCKVPRAKHTIDFIQPTKPLQFLANPHSKNLTSLEANNINTIVPADATTSITYYSTTMMGPYFDPLGETEPHTTKYTLTVLCPPRPPPRWLPAIFTRPGPSKSPNIGSTYTIRPSDYDPANPNYDCFELRHLDGMAQKTIKITSAWFPAHMRCDHVQNRHSCEEGCYVLEKGGDVRRWSCKTEDCEGHVYCGRVLKDREARACFGKKGARMVCIER